MKVGLPEALEEIVEVVRVDGRLQIAEHLMLVVAKAGHELLLFILGLDVGLAFLPETKRI